MYILYIEDDQNDADLTRRYLARHASDIAMDHARTYSEALAKLAVCSREQPIYDMVLTDMRLPDGDGIMVLGHIRSRALPLPVIVLTGTGSEEMAVTALKGGAEDYISKRHDYLMRLPTILEKTLTRYRANVSQHNRPLRVLYAEHHAADIDLTQRHMARYAPHIQLAFVNSAPEVLQRLAVGKNQTGDAESQFDLLLLDYRLPGMNALDLLKELEYHDSPKLPIVLVTGQGDEEVAVQALRLGVTDYLVKNPGYLYQLPRTLENTYTQTLLQRERTALFESEQRYRALFDLAPVVIYTKDTSGVYTSANSLAAEVAGRDPVGYTDAEIFGDEVAAALAAHDQTVFQQGTEVLEEERVSVGNSFRSFLSRKSPLYDHQGNVHGLMGIGLEITERLRAEEHMQQQERLVAVGQMAAGIAHDFNNILAIIMLYTQMLQIAVQQPTQQRHLTTIYQQALHAANLVQQILDFSRRSTMERVTMDTVPFVKELARLWQRTLPESIRVDAEMGNDPLVISADPSRLQQALMNMAINARDAMPEGGVLRITAARMTLVAGQQPPLASLTPGNWLCIDVRDSGTGIPADVLPHIFDPFFTTKAPGVGTGLGLAQVYGIVHQLDGFIHVESEEGTGTLFTIYLPLVDQPASTIEEVQSLPPLGEGETILLVEDEEALRAAMAEMLAELGYVVISAANGREAITLLQAREENIDLVVSDLVMPDMGGKELYTELVQEYSQERPLRMLLVTGYPHDTLAEWQVEQGIIRWLQKPFAMDVFANRVAETLRSGHHDEGLGTPQDAGKR